MTSFEHRCPAVARERDRGTNVLMEREVCRSLQTWELEKANACSACGFVADAEWRRRIAGKLGLDTSALDVSGEQAGAPSIASTDRRGRRATAPSFAESEEETGA